MGSLLIYPYFVYCLLVCIRYHTQMTCLSSIFVFHHVLELLVPQLVQLQLTQLLFHLLDILFDLLRRFFHHLSCHWLRNVLAVLQCFLPCVRLLFVLLSICSRNIRPVFVNRLYLICKLLYLIGVTCIFSCFFFFSTQSSPPILAPSPPSFTHSFSPFFF